MDLKFLYIQIKIMVKKCETCGKEMILQTVQKKGAKNYGDLIARHKNKKFCCSQCQKVWQKNVSWEDRVGVETADRLRKEASDRVSGEKNPSCNSEVAKKISETLKLFLKENPRFGEKNSFYQKHHSEELKTFLSKLYKNKKLSDETYLKILNSRKYGEEHHNWNGGTSFDPYDSRFNNKLKREIKELDKHLCCVCGKKTQKLSVHHIDYNKQNSIVDNLVSLCTKCHGKTNYNRTSWIKFFENYILSGRNAI